MEKRKWRLIDTPKCKTWFCCHPVLSISVPADPEESTFVRRVGGFSYRWADGRRAYFQGEYGEERLTAWFESEGPIQRLPQWAVDTK